MQVCSISTTRRRKRSNFTMRQIVLLFQSRQMVLLGPVNKTSRNVYLSGPKEFSILLYSGSNGQAESCWEEDKDSPAHYRTRESGGQFHCAWTGDLPHLKHVHLTEMKAQVELLICMNMPRAIEPLEVIQSVGDGSFAIKTMLVWTVNGPLSQECCELARLSVNSYSQQSSCCFFLVLLPLVS